MRPWRKRPAEQPAGQIPCPSLLAITSDNSEAQKVAAAFGIDPSEAAGLLANTIQELACRIVKETGRDPDEVVYDLAYRLSKE